MTFVRVVLNSMCLLLETNHDTNLFSCICSQLDFFFKKIFKQEKLECLEI